MGTFITQVTEPDLYPTKVPAPGATAYRVVLGSTGNAKVWVTTPTASTFVLNSDTTATPVNWLLLPE